VVDPNQVSGADIYTMAVQSDGKVLLAGSAEFPNVVNQAHTFLLMRFNADFSVDTSYGPSGTGAVVTPIGYNAGVGGMALQPDGRAVVVGEQNTDGVGAPYSQYFALARYLPSGPQVSSATASPNPAPAGADVTLAARVAAGNPGGPGAVTQVAFYADSNGDGKLDPAADALLGYGTYNADGTWSLTFSTAGWAAGTYTLFARAKDSYGAFSDPFAVSLQVL
jgi:hypothetical protein